MTDFDDLPPPEPKPIDEQNWLQLRDLSERAVLKGHPYEGGEHCGNWQRLLVWRPKASRPRCSRT